MASNQKLGLMPSSGAVALLAFRARCTNWSTRSTSGPATVSSRNSCWASVALASNWAV